MAEVKVSQLADTVGTPVDKLLAQMQDAGLTHNAADEVVSDEDKQTLLAYLKSSHGEEAEAAPKKITLKRKTLSTLKTSGSQGKKTVNVEVRKKRTYVKRSPEELAAEEAAKAAELKAEEERTAEEQAQIEAQRAKEAAEAKEAEEKAKAELAAAKAEKEALEELAKRDPNDPEVKRQLAAARRKEQEKKDAEELEAKKKAKAEEKRIAEEAAEKRKVADAAAKAKEAKESPSKTKTSKTAAKPKRLKAAPDEKQEETKKLKVKGSKGARSRGKDRGHNIHVQRTSDGEYEQETRSSRRKLKRLDVKQQAFEMPTEQKVTEVEVGESISVGSLAQKMNLKAGEVIKELMKLGMMATVNQSLDQDTATLVIEELGHTVKIMSETELEDTLLEGFKSSGGTLEQRAPVVTVMGHVDHGKTSLLDYIRKAHVATGEAGGITQHIGAYHVETERGMITFLDTPGHAAFTAMRARGAQSTDIVILVVAADDGVMPQTEEAVEHARAAGVPLVVAVNKMDKEGADPDRVKNELSAKEVIPEDWGGDTQFMPVSAHTGEGIDELLEAVLLQSELLELKAAADIPAKGTVIESRLDKGRGVVATVLVQEGTLNQGDIVLAGESFGRVRAMVDEAGQPAKQAGPSIPVEILGLGDAPNAGDEFFVVESEKKAREVAEFRNVRTREARLARQQAAKLENMFENMGSEEKQTLNIILKTDVRGSLEALKGALAEIGNDEVAVNVVSSGVGGIAGTDANLALTSNAVIFGFNVRADNTAKDIIEKEAIDLRYYSVIYDIIDDVKSALSGMLSPEKREEIVGVAEVRDVFKSPKFGLIAGSMVVEGTIYRNKPIRVLRDDVVIYEGELESLRRFKDDVNEVRNAMECGIGVKNYLDVKVGDKIEVFDVKEVARTL